MHLGTHRIDGLLTFTVNTHSPTTGAETDADAAPAYRVYERETGTAILTGTMALFDDANTVGFYSEEITLSAANGFEEGKMYTVRIRAVVGGVAASIERTFLVEAALATQASVNTIDDFLDTEMAAVLAAVDTEVAAIKAKTDNLPASPANEATLTTIAGYLDTEVAAILAAVDTEVAAIKAKTDLLAFDGSMPVNVEQWNGTSVPAEHAAGYPIVTVKDGAGTGELDTTAGKVGLTAGDIAALVDAIWDELQAGHTVPDSFGEYLDAAVSGVSTGGVSAGDIADAVWNRLTSALTTVNSIGKLLVDRIDAAITSRASQASVDTVDDLLDTEVAAIKAKTDLIPDSPAAVGSAMTLTSGERDSIAAALLDLSAGVEVGLTPRQALRLMAAALAGELSGAATTTIVIRNAVADSKDRITATVDADGNRTAVAYDLT
jgi:hypothetical protein